VGAALFNGIALKHAAHPDPTDQALLPAAMALLDDAFESFSLRAANRLAPKRHDFSSY
jgi:hypothetical protein